MPTSPFITDSGSLRSGWRFAIFMIAYPLFWVAIAAAIYLIVFENQQSYTFLMFEGYDLEFFFNVLARFLAAVAALLFVSRFVERKPASAFIGFDRWPRNLGVGLAIGGGLVGLLFAGFAVAGIVRAEWASPPGATHILFIALTFLIAVANEELLFRGYPMQALADGIGPWPAAAVMSALFGLLHLRNPHASGIGIMNTVIAGLMLSAAFFKVRSLWLPIGIHLAWNVGLGLVLGFSLSGLDRHSLWKSTVDGAPVFTGGLYGPEGGIPCTIIFLVGLAAVRRIRARSGQTSDTASERIEA